MKYYIIAGEASGDLHAANLMQQLKQKDAAADFRYWGGDLMQAQGGTLIKHYRALAFMGFAEVLRNLRTILGNIAFCKKDITQYKPDAIIFVDYPGFNLRLARWVKRQGYATHYYISPQIWAWKENRIRAIKRDVDAMYVILPFEKEFYEQKHNYPVHFVGHPLIDAIAKRRPVSSDEFRRRHNLDQRPVVALLPGSRKQEIKKMLSLMLAVANGFPDYQFVIAGAPGQDENFYQPFVQTSNVHLLMNQTYELLAVSHAAMVTSGTATLETALFKVPQVVCYKGSRISYEIAKRVIKLKYISLVNLILDREAVTELIQTNLTQKTLTTAFQKLLDDSHRIKMLDDYNQLENKLGGAGASEKTAGLIFDSLVQQKETTS